MIELTRLNNKSFYLNSDLIEMIEATPDTVITLTNGKKLVVSDATDDIINQIVEFRYRCFHEGRMAARSLKDSGKEEIV
jgi:flagellar protein FlbD